MKKNYFVILLFAALFIGFNTLQAQTTLHSYGQYSAPTFNTLQLDTSAHQHQNEGAINPSKPADNTIEVNTAFVGSIDNTTLTIAGYTTGKVAVGQLLIGPGIAEGTKVVSGSGNTWQLNVSNSVTGISILAGSPSNNGLINGNTINNNAGVGVNNGTNSNQ